MSKTKIPISASAFCPFGLCIDVNANFAELFFPEIFGPHGDVYLLAVNALILYIHILLRFHQLGVESLGLMTYILYRTF